MESKKYSIKEARESVGLSQDDFAKKIDMKYGTYVKKELYLRGLTAVELIAISDATNIPVRNILLKKQ